MVDALPEPKESVQDTARMAALIASSGGKPDFVIIDGELCPLTDTGKYRASGEQEKVAAFMREHERTSTRRLSRRQRRERR